MIESEDVSALKKVINLIKEFSEKNIIKKKKFNFSKLIDKVESINAFSDLKEKERVFNRVLQKLKVIIQQDEK